VLNVASITQIRRHISLNTKKYAGAGNNRATSDNYSRNTKKLNNIK